MVSRKTSMVELIQTFSNMYNKVFLMRRLFEVELNESSFAANHINEPNTILSQLSLVKIKFEDR